MKKLSFICLFTAAIPGLSLLSTNGATAQLTRHQRNVFHAGERLQYKVKWLMFRLGTIVFQTHEIPGRSDTYRITLTLDSNPDIFFISIQNRYEAIVSNDPLRCEFFKAHERLGTDTLVTTYQYVDSLKQVAMTQRILPADTVVRQGVLDSVDRFYEGSSLFFFARSMLHSHSSTSVPTLVEMESFLTHITFTENRIPVSISGIEESLDSKELRGRAAFEGKTFAGFSGEFKGWFSNDSSAVPLRAELSITLGSVKVELEQWTRAGWKPPLYRRVMDR